MRKHSEAACGPCRSCTQPDPHPLPTRSTNPYDVQVVCMDFSHLLWSWPSRLPGGSLRALSREWCSQKALEASSHFSERSPTPSASGSSGGHVSKCRLWSTLGSAGSEFVPRSPRGCGAGEEAPRRCSDTQTHRHTDTPRFKYSHGTISNILVGSLTDSRSRPLPGTPQEHATEGNLGQASAPAGPAPGPGLHGQDAGSGLTAEGAGRQDGDQQWGRECLRPRVYAAAKLHLM